ncbi:putative porin [uncultured Paraglaciecola sp.]|uniref:putative porin n=1 Tax=uncultured Paraglaciecola sp. TaxID=1765024 RepID=UPI0030DD142B|tara:strand:+ start:56 stop:1081 length:1026 start_codon:yes stop_codon:yes gene_type:complete
MRQLMAAITLTLSSTVYASNIDVFGDAVLRYENESQHVNLPDRERLRAIFRLGIKGNITDNWSAQGRLSTGLKNKQNVPAITLIRFNTQPQPDRDVFVERLFLTGKFTDANLYIGKIPWKTNHITDVFWDRNLHPLGVHLDYRLSERHQIQLASLKPLDGNSDVVGLLNIVQWNMTFSFDKVKVTFSPSYVDYNGQSNAQFAKKDTQLDNRFLRLSSSLSFKGYQLGVDLGQSLSDFDQFEEFSEQKTSMAVQLKHGKLAQAGDYSWHLRYLHVERFGVITEFAQNATARFATSNVQGLDVRLRRKMADTWWLGARVSDMRTIEGPEEQGLRIRIEGQYKF